ncbi:T9SS type A sorting domain-containing protein [Hymenobacter algoricola]|uniref:Secretion system C-terminal sorting domain-containing protein n=1 Tax=Hymenobacter algoricola TaxID=486267 RepID=A0ABP7NXW3_9BACT
MKTTLLKTLALVLLALLARFTTVAAQSQPPAAHPGHPARQEIRAYYQANVLPAVRQQRQKLEARLATDDRALLATYRTQLRDVRQRGHALRQSLRPRGDEAAAFRPELTPAQRQQGQQLRAEGRGIMLNVARLAQKYEADITRLGLELQPRQEQWTNDIKAIVAKNAPAGQTPPLGRGHRGGLGRFGRPVRFLLLDPTAAPPQSAAGLGSTAFPNPVATTMQLEYAVKKAGPVTVEVLDGRGTVLRTVVQAEPQEKGPHTVAADVSTLPAGTYFYKITTRTGVETKRFVKQ